MAHLDRQSVSLLAEKLGERRLSPDIEEFLSDYIETKVREIVEIAHKYQRHSHRKCLQVKDIRRSMRQLSLDVTLQPDSIRLPCLAVPSLQTVR